MGNNSASSSVDWDQQYLLAKMMLIHYGVMHPFFEQQLRYYVIACCQIAIDGTFKLNPETHTVQFDIQTEKYYKKQGKQTIKRYNFFPVFTMTPKKYKTQCEIASKNLKEWTDRLLWTGSTSIKVIIDGREQ